MPIYSNYDGLLQEVRRTQRSLGEKFQRSEIHKYLATVTDHMYRMFYTSGGHMRQELLLSLFENVHYSLSHTVYYVDSEFARKMIQADMKFMFNDISIPMSLFELCFEDDFEILPGVRAPSTLVTIKPEGAIRSGINRFAAESLDRIGCPVKIGAESIIDMRQLFRMSYLMGGGICHAAVPIDEFNGKSVDEVISTIGTFRESTFGAMTELSSTEVEVQKCITKVIMGVVAYLNTREPDVLSWKNRNRPSFSVMKPVEYLIGSNVSNAKWFIRSGGPVVLAHPRYKRDEHGNIRVIFRRAAEVNKHARPAIPDERKRNIYSEL